MLMKRLVLSRQITNWDTETLEGRLRLLISRLSYPGQVTITFSLLHAKVTVQPPQKTFAALHNLFRSTKKYELKAVWPYADLGVEHAAAGGSGGGGGRQRSFAVQSEEDWWRDWRDAVKWAVLGRRKGWVTSEDRLEGLMGMRREGEAVWSDS